MVSHRLPSSAVVACVALLLTVCGGFLPQSATAFSSPASHNRHGREHPAPISRQPAAPAPLAPFPWFDYTLPLATRVSALVNNLTLTEKLSLMTNIQPAIPRVGLVYYNWESEGSHGVARAGRATVFPSPIMLASTWDVELSREAGRVVAMEGRGKFNDYTAKHGGNNTRWSTSPRTAAKLPHPPTTPLTSSRLSSLIRRYGLDFYAPNINLFLHAKWGRGQETYGEGGRQQQLIL